MQSKQKYQSKITVLLVTAGTELGANQLLVSVQTSSATQDLTHIQQNDLGWRRLSALLPNFHTTSHHTSDHTFLKSYHQH